MVSIEFVGAPGVGKSTQKAAVIEQLSAEGFRSYLTVEDALLHVARRNIDRPMRLLLNLLPRPVGRDLLERIGPRSYWFQEAQIRFLADSYPALEGLLNAPIFQQYSPADKQALFAGFLPAGATLECLKAGGLSHSSVVFDEGLVQKSMMFVAPCVHALDEESVSVYLQRISHPEVLFLFAAPYETCLKRMTARPKGTIRRLQGVSEQGLKRMYDNSRRHWAFVADWFDQHTRTQVVWVPALPRDETRQFVVSALQKVDMCSHNSPLMWEESH